MQRAIRWFRWALCAALFASVLGAAPAAEAQRNRVEAGYKATVGLGLLGAELGFVIPVASGLDETWSLITFPLVGAAGGAVGGYYLDRANVRAASVTSLVLGIAFAVPSIIITVGATRYSADDLADDTQALELRLRLDAQLASGDGLIRRVDGRFRLSMPGVHFGQASASARSATELGPPLGTTVGATLFSGSF